MPAALDLIVAYWPFVLFAVAAAVAVVLARGDLRTEPAPLDELAIARAGRPHPAPIETWPAAGPKGSAT